MRTIKILFVSYFLILLSCSDNNLPIDSTSLVNGSEEIIIKNDSDIFPEDVLSIEEVVIHDNTLQLTVQYGGGCGEVEFKLIGDSSFMESNPVQSNITLSFIDQDSCEALIKTELSYDLSPLASIYKDMYQVSGGTIILLIKGFETPVRYSF